MNFFMNNIKDIQDLISSNEIILLKFDEENSKYNQFIESIELKIINITDKDIIEFYDIDVLPTILVFKNKNLIDSIKGFKTKTTLLQKILEIIGN